MIRRVLALFGRGLGYRDGRRLDFAMGRPMHDSMSVAMPTAKAELYRLRDYAKVRAPLPDYGDEISPEQLEAIQALAYRSGRPTLTPIGPAGW